VSALRSLAGTFGANVVILLGAFMLAAFFVLAFRRVYARSGRRMKAGARSVGLGVLVAVSAFLAHAFVDFNMHILADMAIFMAMWGWVTVFTLGGSGDAGAPGDSQRILRPARVIDVMPSVRGLV